MDRERGMRVIAAPRPSITEPESRKDVQWRRLRSAICDANSDEDVFRGAFCVFDEDVEVAVLVKDAGVDQLEFAIEFSSAAVFIEKALVGICGLGIFVKILHVGVRGR